MRLLFRVNLLWLQIASIFAVVNGFKQSRRALRISHSTFRLASKHDLISVSMREHPLEGRELIVRMDYFKSFVRGLIEDPAGSKRLLALSSCTEVIVSKAHSLKAIHCGHDIVKDIPGADIIFTRDFYKELLGDIRLRRRCILVGNPGIGKSHFQHYYLARIMNPSLFGPLPPDSNGCTDAPKIVIRQVSSRMTVYDIENRVAYECDAADLVLRSFDPKVTLYLFDRLPKEPLYRFYQYGVDSPSFGTLLPVSYRDDAELNATKKYMPLYTLGELKAAGKYLLKKNSVADDMKKYFTPAKIGKRHLDFGGIFRHVLPKSILALEEYHENLQRALDPIDVESFFSDEKVTIENGKASTCIKAMITERDGANRFASYSTEDVSHRVATHYRNVGDKIPLEDCIALLIKWDKLEESK